MTDDIKLKITHKTEFQALQDLIIVTVAFFVFDAIILFYADLPYLALLLLAFYAILYFTPVIILHSNYENVNKNKELIFRTEKLQFGNEIIEYKDIERIKAIGTYQSINKNSFSELPYQCAYFYIKIEMKNGNSIYLTNLYSKNLIDIVDNKIYNHTIEKELTSFPLIKNYS